MSNIYIYIWFNINHVIFLFIGQLETLIEPMVRISDMIFQIHAYQMLCLNLSLNIELTLPSVLWGGEHGGAVAQGWICWSMAQGFQVTDDPHPFLFFGFELCDSKTFEYASNSDCFLFLNITLKLSIL